MARRYYNNVSTTGALASSVGPSDTTLNVNGFSSVPTVPFTIVVGRDTLSEEVCLVTQALGTAFTVSRGYDGTTGANQAAGATVEHAMVAEGPNKWDEHVEATEDVHGVSGGFVGTTSTQTLTNKTITDSVYESTNSTSPAGAAGFEAVVDTADKPGFLADTTGQSAADAVRVAQSGVPRFRVLGNGAVEVTPAGATVAMDVNGRVDVDTDLNVGGNAGVTGAVNAGSVAASGLVSGADGDFSGSVSAASAAITGPVTGVTTLDASGEVSAGSVTSSGAVSGTDGNFTGNLDVNGTGNIAGRLDAGSDVFAVGDVAGERSVAGWKHTDGTYDLEAFRVTSGTHARMDSRFPAVGGAAKRSLRQGVMHQQWSSAINIIIGPSLTLLSSFSWTQRETGNASLTAVVQSFVFDGGASAWAQARLMFRLRRVSDSALLFEQNFFTLNAGTTGNELGMGGQCTMLGTPDDILTAATEYKFEILGVETPAAFSRDQLVTDVFWNVQECVRV